MHLHSSPGSGIPRLTCHPSALYYPSTRLLPYHRSFHRLVTYNPTPPIQAKEAVRTIRTTSVLSPERSSATYSRTCPVGDLSPRSLQRFVPMTVLSPESFKPQTQCPVSFPFGSLSRVSPAAAIAQLLHMIGQWHRIVNPLLGYLLKLFDTDLGASLTVRYSSPDFTNMLPIHTPGRSCFESPRPSSGLSPAWHRSAFRSPPRLLHSR